MMTLAENDLPSITLWAERVDRHDHPSIHIAVSRTVSAAGERDRPDDGLIDAVIAWENLFGHGGTTEVGFRVTSALTLLVERNVDRREEQRRELQRLYDARSKIVHGAEIGGRLNLNEAWEKAVEVAVEALRILFGTRPALIANRERGLRLILGLPD